MNRQHILPTAGSSLAILLAISSATAADLTWDANNTGANQTDGAGAWLNADQWWDGSVNVNWADFVAPNAVFGNGGTGGAVTLASPTTVGSLTFNAFSGTYTLGTSGQALALNGGITKNSGSGAVTFAGPITLGAAQTWTNNSTGLLLTGNGTNLINNGGNQLTIDGSGNTTFGVLNNAAVTLSGSGALVKNGTGILSIGGNNTGFSGSVTLNAGILNYGDNPGSLGSGNLHITNGVLESRWNTGKTWTQGTGAGQIQITGGESGFAVNGNTGATFNIGAITWGSATFDPTKFVLQTQYSQGNSNITLSSAINLNGATRTIAVNAGTTGAARAILSGAISNSTGTAGLIKEGDGMLNLTNNSSAWNGNTTVSSGILDFGGINLANIGGGSGRNISVAAGAGARFNTLSNAILNRIAETNDEIIVMTGTTSNSLDFSSSTGANLPGAFLSNWAGNGAKAELSGIITPGGGAYRLGSLKQSGALGIRQESLLSGNNQLIIGGNRVVIVGAHTFTGDTTIRNGGRLGLASLNGTGTNSLALQNSVLDLGTPSATGQVFLEAATTAGFITGANTSANGGTTSATFGGLEGSRNLYNSFLFSAPGNNTSATTAANITGFTLNPGTGVTATYSGAIGGFGAGASGANGGAMTLTKTGDGTQVLSGTSSYTGATNVVAGTLVIDGNTSSSVLTTVESGATLAGSGTVGDLTIDIGGFFSPGASPGIMTVAGDYIQNGTLVTEVTGLTPGVGGHDQVVVNGAITLNGALQLTLDTFTPVNGDLIFILLNDGTDAISGTFTGLAQGDVATTYGGFDWQISYLADSGDNTFIGGNDVALLAVAIPEPSAALLGACGFFMLLRRRRR